MKPPLVILGSARPDGETRRAVDIAFPDGSAELAILPNFAVGGYDYAHLNAQDAFGSITEAMAATDKIIFATPVYWYAMSAPLKIFFDRLTDLTENLKARGKAMAGKSVWLIATGTEAGLPDGFEIPFACTAQYFSMAYRGAAYLYTGEDADLRAAGETALATFGVDILQFPTLPQGEGKMPE
jgi:multimeric flavodoxin WrbA